MAVRLAARVQIPIKQSSSQLTTAPWRPQQKSEADRIQQKLHKKISLGVADADVSCLSVSVCVCGSGRQICSNFVIIDDF